jgi:hypothetical protein
MGEEIIPDNSKGIQTNTESSIELADEQNAKDVYQTVKSRLLHVNQWHELAGKASAVFQLTDKNGHSVERWAQAGDHIRIDIPGPGPITGEGDDWVHIEEISDTNDTTIMRVRPATNPLNERQDVAHFFSEEASSSFMAKREGNKITAAVYGRNEKPNTNTEKLVDKIRNIAVASGAITGFSKLQWKSLVDGLVKVDTHKR